MKGVDAEEHINVLVERHYKDDDNDDEHHQ